MQSGGSFDERLYVGAALDYGLAGPTDGGEHVEIGSKTRQHRRGWEGQEGAPWPVTEDGRNFDAHHKVPKAYGGPDTLGNIEPKHPVPHRQDHMNEGDFREWGSWSRKGRGGGGVPPRDGPKIRGLGLFGIIPNITGLLSGRIHTDTFDNFTSDMQGLPSEEDQRRTFENYQRMLNPKWRPGDPIEV